MTTVAEDMADEAVMDATLMDQTVLAAQQALHELSEAGDISASHKERAELWLSELRGAVHHALQSQAQLSRDEGVLQQELEKAKQAEVLREDEETARAEAALDTEKVAVQETEVVVLQHERDALTQQVKTIRDEHRERLIPKVEELQRVRFKAEHGVTGSSVQEIESLHRELEAKEKHTSSLHSHWQKLTSRAQTEAEAKAALEGELRDGEQNVEQVSAMIEKAERQTDLVSALLAQAEEQHMEKVETLAAAEGRLAGHRLHIQQQEDGNAGASTDLERLVEQVHERQATIDSLSTDVALMQVEAEKITAEQAELTLQAEHADADLKQHQDALAAVTREKASHEKRCQKMHNVLKVVSTTLPSLKEQKAEQESKLQLARVAAKDVQTDITTAKNDVDVEMSMYLTEEMEGRSKNSMFVFLQEQVLELDASARQYQHAQAQRHQALCTLSAARDKAARFAGQQSQRVKQVRDEAALKDNLAKDLRKTRRAVVSRVRDFQQLYDLVKNQRNKFVTLIQASKQGIAELRERQRILDSELTILRMESQEKEEQLRELRKRHGADVTERNSERMKLNKVRTAFKERVAKVDEQISEMAKLNALINGAESGMVSMRKQYEVIVELRNYTGIMLIDRNDELCILYEKADVQDGVMRAGDVAMLRIEDEARRLRIEVSELDRAVKVTRKIVPRVPTLDANVATLQRDILLARRQVQELEAQIEDPGNPARWRPLKGRVQDRDELRIKVNQLEGRLNDKEEQVLIRDLILEEADSAAVGTLTVAKQANTYHVRLRTITTKMMATISELSMYQANALRLGEERRRVESAVQEARRRLADGLCPTMEAEREWEGLVREEAVTERLRATHDEVQRILDARGAFTKTTAEPRPHAYIPEQLCIPKPYGTFSPYKPTDPSATQRLMRKPQLREVVI